MKKRIVCLTLALIMSATQVVSVSASREDELREEQAITLAKKYMSRYAGYTKYTYNTSSGNYIRRGNYLRWNRSTLSDPDGYLNMTADQILADLFN